MSKEKKRKALLSKLTRNLMISVPIMTVVAMAGFNIHTGSNPGLIPSAEAAQGEAEGEAEGEGVSASLKKAVRRPEGYTSYQGDVAELRTLGEKLFNDNSLSSNGLSCATCHTNGMVYLDTFKNQYPHFVAMGKRDFGMDMVHLNEMVQICMMAPMAAEPLEWGSKELAALTEYTLQEQQKYIDKQ
jgi:mono/diheme cytochrome c family protein